MKRLCLRFKGLAIILGLIVASFSFAGPIFAAGATLSISPSSGTFNQGCAVPVNILLDTGGILTDGADALLFYDPTRLTATVSDIQNGTIYTDYPGNIIDAQNGKITISGVSSISSGYTGSGVLATINFRVVSTAPAGVTQLRFDFDPNDKPKTSDSNVAERQAANDVLNQVNNGAFTIGTGTACGGNSVPGTKPGTGGTSTPSATLIPTKAPLPQSADFQTTMILAAAGGLLTLLGIIGLALL